jgi:hypothetical protein
MTDNAQRNKAIVREFLTKTFTDRDFTALERWLSPDTSSTIRSFPVSERGYGRWWNSIPRAGATSPE